MPSFGQAIENGLGRGARPPTLVPRYIIPVGVYVVTLSDGGSHLVSPQAVAQSIVVPTDRIPFPRHTVIEIYQAGAGLVTFSAETGCTLRNAGAMLGQYSLASLIKEGPNEWVCNR